MTTSNPEFLDLEIELGLTNGPAIPAPSLASDLANENTTGKPNFTTEQAANQLARDERKWDGGELGTPGDATYSFLPQGQTSRGQSQLSLEQMETAKTAMEIISSVANISFSAADGGTGNNLSHQGEIQLQSSPTGGWASYSMVPGEETAEMFRSTVSFSESGLAIALHEICHAVGLAHPSDYDGGNVSYSLDAEFYQDTKQYSVMSYFSGSYSGAVLSTYAAQGNSMVYKVGATGLGLHDIAALQLIYGANETTYTGDTTYGFNSNTGDAGWTLDGPSDWIHAAIWDAGGNDTIDMSGYSEDAVIDLRQEAFSSTGGLTHNLAIAKGAEIENAIGGGGDDVLQGNELDNNLSGGSGDDTLIGGGGDDTIDGGIGDDLAKFEGNLNEYEVIKFGDGSIQISDTLGRDGTDTLSSVENFVFADVTKTSKELLETAPTVDVPAEPTPTPVVEPEVVPNPVEPEEPSEPFAPDQPAEPTQPVEPKEPIAEVNPEEPACPINPEEPVPTNLELVFKPGEFNELVGGEGNDTADFSAAKGSIFVDLSEGDFPEAWGISSNSFPCIGWEAIADLSDVENVKGSDFDDILVGDGGTNILYGGAGSDRFIFSEEFGNDFIGDFENGKDLMLFASVDGLTSTDQLDVRQDGDDAVVTFGDYTVTLLGIDAASLSNDAFALSDCY